MNPESDDELDFRDEAEAASETLLAAGRRHGGAPPPAGAPLGENTSYCVRAPGGGRGALRGFRWPVLLALVVGLGGVGAGGLIIFLQNRGIIGPAKVPAPPGARRPAMTPDSEVPLIVVAAACSLTGMATLFLIPTLQRRRVMSIVGQRAWGARLPGAGGVIPVSVEDQSTMEGVKVVADDIGILMPEPDARRVRIEGVSHRYLIRAPDLVSLDLEASRYHERVLVTYHIGDVVLSLAVVHEGIGAAFWRQITGRPSALYRRMSECLEDEGLSQESE
jgi:hypothetical protein